MMKDKRVAALSLYTLTLMIAILIYPAIIGEMRGEFWRILLFAAIAFLAILFSALATLFAPLIALRARSGGGSHLRCREDTGGEDRGGGSPFFLLRRLPPRIRESC